MDNVYGTIYLLTNTVTGMCYVGLTTKTVEGRFKKHVSASIDENKKSYIARAINKYGSENFTIVPICTAISHEELCELEILMINELCSMYPNGYNLTSGGELTVYSAESRAKMSASQLGHFTSEKTRKKISKTLTGRTLSDSHKRNMGIATKRRFLANAKPFLVHTQSGMLVGEYLIQRNCAKSLNLDTSNVSLCLSGKRKSHKGYTFTYVNNGDK